MPPSSQTLAEVKVTKMKECPMLTAGKITPLILQSWTLACRRYLKHGGRTPTDVVSYVAEGMFKPRLVVWYQADQTRINTLTLDQYLKELSLLVLEKNWAHDILEAILSSSQGSQPFMDWKIEMENLNAILTTSAPTKALSKDQLKVQLQANLHPDLRLSLSLEPVIATELAAWAFEVREHDDRLRAEDARTQRLIDASQSACAARRGEKKDLLSRLTNAPVASSSSSPPAVAGRNKAPRVERKKLSGLTQDERDLLKLYNGCMRCRLFNIDHTVHTCPMVATNSWPNPDTYVTLTAPVAAAAQDAEDVETDSYVPPAVELPFTVPHLYAPLSLMGPLITEFPISTKALIDVGCPCTVISQELCESLGLRRYKLPARENNLLSLSNSPLSCMEYVKLKVQSGQGRWESGVVKMKVNKGLCFPIILGMPFLSSEHIVIDARKRTAVDTRSGYNLVNPLPFIPRPVSPPRVVPPPMPKKVRVPKPPSLEQTGPPALAGSVRRSSP